MRRRLLIIACILVHDGTASAQARATECCSSVTLRVYQGLSSEVQHCQIAEGYRGVTIVARPSAPGEASSGRLLLPATIRYVDVHRGRSDWFGNAPLAGPAVVCDGTFVVTYRTEAGGVVQGTGAYSVYLDGPTFKKRIRAFAVSDAGGHRQTFDAKEWRVDVQ